MELQGQILRWVGLHRIVLAPRGELSVVEVLVSEPVHFSLFNPTGALVTVEDARWDCASRCFLGSCLRYDKVVREVMFSEAPEDQPR